MAEQQGTYTILYAQDSKAPLRKVRFAGVVALVLLVANLVAPVFGFTASDVDLDPQLVDGIRALVNVLGPIVAAYLAKSDTKVPLPPSDQAPV